MYYTSWKKIPQEKNIAKSVFCKNLQIIYNFWMPPLSIGKKMKIDFDEYEKDVLLETLQYRIDNDERLILSEGIKDDIQELLRKVEDEYL